MAATVNVNPKRGLNKSKNDPNSSSMNPSETHSVLFEWPLSGLKSMFESTKADTKSRVVKSTSFDGGRWTVLFYAQSGTDQFCSLYLNAEPLPHERIQPLNANSWMQASKYDQSKGKNEPEESWTREGNYRFTFTIQTPDKSVVLGTKEANNHMFSMKTSNWGWAQFSKRDTVYYSNQMVKTADQFIITVSITANAEKPRLMSPPTLTVPPQLVQAMGSLLDDPDHSDVVFHLVSQRRPRISRRSKNDASSSHQQSPTPVRRIYAIKKILSSRCEYFADMFEGGFAEAECAEYSDDESDEVWSAESPSKDSNYGEISTSNSNHHHHHHHHHQVPEVCVDEEEGHHGEATQANNNNENSKDMDLDEFYSDEEDDEDNLILEDSDEELEGSFGVGAKENSPLTFGFGARGKSSSNQTHARSDSSRKSDVIKTRSRGHDGEGDDEEEDQDDDEFVEEDEVVGLSKPGVISQSLSNNGALTIPTPSNIQSISSESSIQQIRGNQNETPNVAFGSLSAVDHSALNSNLGSNPRSQPNNSFRNANLTSPSTSFPTNPEIPTQSHMSRSNSQSNSSIAASTTSFTLSNSHSAKLTNPGSPLSSHTSTPVKKSNLPQTAKSVPSSNSKRSREKSEGRNRSTDRRKRRKVVVRDSAYNTYKALLYYLYTDTITFAPLTSSFLSTDSAQNDVEGDTNMVDSHRSSGLNAENYQLEMIKAHKRRQAMIDWWCAQNPDKPSPCSAKAMYKLADKLQIPELKRRAQEHIAASLTVQNIVWEVFSGFNAQFAEIRKMETDFLLQHWSVIKRSSAMKTIFFRSQAHPGLAEVWPYLLSQLEYKASGDDSDSEETELL